MGFLGIAALLVAELAGGGEEGIPGHIYQPRNWGRQ